jgi:prophage regulatory protein
MTQTDIIKEGDRIVREEECDRVTGLSRTTRWRLERRGDFPRRRQITSTSTGWLLSEIMDWLKSRPIGSSQPTQLAQAQEDKRAKREKAA